MEELIVEAERTPDAPFAGCGHALRRLRDRGATEEELGDLVRGMQVQFMFTLCYMLDDPGLADEGVEMYWALVQTDAAGQVLARIEGLHESVLETDTTGPGMRPRPPGG
jgi:hypothetical protein